MSHDPAVWFAVFLTLSIFSFLYKDNVFYKIAEHIFVGVSAAWAFATNFQAEIIDDMLLKVFPHAFYQNSHPDFWPLGGGILGFMILFRLLPGFDWLSRWGIAFVVGLQTGLQLFSTIQNSILSQLKATLLPLFIPRNWGQSIKNCLMVGGTFTSLSYFYFSKEQKGGFGILTRIGIWFLMISFGASYGATVMTRISILLGRVYFLLSTWLGIIH